MFSLHHRPAPVISGSPESESVPRAEPPSKSGNPDSYVVNGKRYYTLRSAQGFTERGIASWYGNPFHGRRTSSGEIYDMYRMTAAHKQLPLPTYVEVRNLRNGRVATVRVNDRGPFHDNRVIDLSYAAALKLDITSQGTAFVEIRAIGDNGIPIPATASSVTPPRVSTAVSVTVPASSMAPTAPAGAGLYLQVGSFADRQNAVRLSERIGKVVTSSIEIREITSQNLRLYRVQIGPLTDVERADSAVAALEQIGITEHYFITN